MFYSFAGEKRLHIHPQASSSARFASIEKVCRAIAHADLKQTPSGRAQFPPRFGLVWMRVSGNCCSISKVLPASSRRQRDGQVVSTWGSVLPPRAIPDRDCQPSKGGMDHAARAVLSASIFIIAPQTNAGTNGCRIWRLRPASRNIAAMASTARGRSAGERGRRHWLDGRRDFVDVEHWRWWRLR